MHREAEMEWEREGKKINKGGLNLSDKFMCER